MYINGRKITLDELEELANNLIGGLIDELYKNILTDGIDISVPGTKYKQRKILRKIEKHFIEIEQYEKCAILRDLIKSNFNLNNNKDGKK